MILGGNGCIYDVRYAELPEYETIMNVASTHKVYEVANIEITWKGY